MILNISQLLSCILFVGLPLIVLFFALFKSDFRWILGSALLFIILLIIYKLQFDNSASGFVIYQIVILYAFALAIVQFLFIFRYRKQLSSNTAVLAHAQLIRKNWIKEVIKIQEGERERISRDLHDDVGATISALALHLSNTSFEEDDIQQYRQRSTFLINKVANDIRSISHDLLPRDFSQNDLFSVIENTIANLNKTGTISFQFIQEGDEGELDSSTTAMMILRIVNELITNINKHAQATEASVQLAIWKKEIQIIVEDNGIGMNAVGGQGIGLLNITSRVNYLNGKLNIDSNYKGTTVVIVIPNSAVSE